MRQRRKIDPNKEGNMERWLITYSDLITLLLILFVLLYAMSQIDARKYAAVANSLSVELTGQSMSVLDAPGPSMIQGISGQNLPEGFGTATVNQGELDEVKKMITEFINTQDVEIRLQAQGKNTATKLSDYIIIYEQERGLVVSFKDTLLFPSGSDQLTPQAQALIREIGKNMVKIPNYIRVEGHTDDLPINTAKFPSNWELSALRASNVVHVLNEDAGIPAERLSIIGFGEHRPLVANEDGISRAMNRRVDIVILKKKYDYFEPSNITFQNKGVEDID